MDFVEHLKKYLSSNEIDELISSFDDEDEHALLLNTEKISPKSFINMYPNNKKLEIIGPYSDKQNKNKTSDIYDAISIGVAFSKKFGSGKVDDGE